MSEFGVAFH